LIQIKYSDGAPMHMRATRSTEHRQGTVKDHKNKQRYPLPCPVCRTAMIGHKTDPSLPDYDRFECLRCGAVVLREDSGPDASTA
jgi:hypothetical protein